MSHGTSRPATPVRAPPAAAPRGATRTILGPGAWFDHYHDNPFNVPHSALKDLQRLAPDAEEYIYFGQEKKTKHASKNFALPQFKERIQQKLGSTVLDLHVAPAKNRSWSVPERFRLWLENRYPSTTGKLRNLCVLKNYRSGVESMGEHNDAQSEPCTAVGSLSVGQTRSMIVRENKSIAKSSRQRRKWIVELAHGDTFMMCGHSFQKNYTHELPQGDAHAKARVGIVWRARPVLEDRKRTRKSNDGEKRTRQAKAKTKFGTRKTPSAMKKLKVTTRRAR